MQFHFPDPIPQLTEPVTRRCAMNVPCRHIAFIVEERRPALLSPVNPLTTMTLHQSASNDPICSPNDQ